MIKKVMDFLKEWRVAIVLAAAFIAFQVLILQVDLAQLPNGTIWLGAHSVNTSDMAVYLGYLAQGKNSFLISNLFNDHPQIPRFDAFWSIAGLLVRAGMAPVVAHEALRYLCGIILAFSVYAAAKAMTKNRKDAVRTTFFLAVGMAAGWINGIWLGIVTAPDPARAMSPDLETEFGLVPMLLGGAHMILSLALQLAFARWAWDGINHKNWRKTLLACLTVAYFTAFHPYFISWAGLFVVIAMLWRVKREELLPRAKHFLAICAAMLPSAAYYIYLLADDTAFREHHTLANKLPLEHPLIWAVALSPIAIAGIWQWFKRNKHEGSRLNDVSWIWAWLASAVVCMLLPFPWTAKYTQGLLLVLTALTLPAWLAAADWAAKRVFWLRWMLIGLCLLPILYLFKQEMTVNASMKWNGNFYQYVSTMRAVRYLGQNSPPDAITVAPNTLIDLWTPAYAARHAWIGHPHETPDYQDRLAEFKKWATSTNSGDFLSFLDAKSISYVILPKDPNSDYVKFFDVTWRRIFEQEGAQVWERVR